MNKTVYVVSYQETTLGENNEFVVESGICNYGYKNKVDAIKEIKELAAEKCDECIDVLGYDEEDVSIEVDENSDMQTVNCGSNTFKYWVSVLKIV